MKKLLLGIFLVFCVMFIVKPVTALADTVNVKSRTELQDAINNATSDRTIILDNAIFVSVNTITINSGYSFTINLNKYELRAHTAETIKHMGAGNVTILGGTVSTLYANAISNDGNGSVTISGSTAWSDGGYAINNNSTGSVILSGGSVWTSRHDAICNYSTGSVILSDCTVIAETKGITNVSTGSVIIQSGTVIIQASTCAIDTTTLPSGYDNMQIKADASDMFSTNPQVIDMPSSVGNLATYKYLEFSPIPTDEPIVATAKLAAEGASYSNMTQAAATSETVIEDALQTIALAAVNNADVTVTINKSSYTAPIAGTSADPNGTDGSYVFDITVSKGEQSETTNKITISITATAYTGVSDVQAVASAKAALVNGSVSVAFGADQSIKTAAVQAYVDDILDGTAEALGVTAAVTYNSTSETYDVALNKGSINDSKSLTMTVTVAPDPDIAVVNSAKSAAESASYANMTQVAATSETVIADALQTIARAAVNNADVTVTINKDSYTAPIAGTSANPNGTDGSYVFAITVSKGGQSETTEKITTSVTATAYTGVTDVQAVASAKAALVNGSVSVAFGADQSIKTAAVQAYVDDILDGTAEALGVTATVTYNSTTETYDVALNKGSINDSKSLTMTIIVAPDPTPPTPPTPPAPAGSTQATDAKTITVVEVPQSIPDEELLKVEPVGEAFDNSVEVRLKEDTITEGMVRTAMESVSSALNIENAQIFPLDISIYLKGTNTKVQPKEGTAVMITCPIPKEMLINMDKLVVVCIIDGKLQVLPSTLVTKDGVPCVQFTANHFSPYAFVVDKDNNLADYAAGILPDVVTKISTKLTANAGTVTKVDLEGIREGSTITYHVCTPTLISIDNNGNLFAKKAGNAVLMANVIYGGATKLYTIRVTVKYAKGGTKAGFIQNYDDIITCDNINYRITAKATDTVKGTVAVANNQINKNLPKKVVIPETITYKGKTYKVTSIDESAFYNLNKITSVTIPAGVKEISATAFVSCDSLKTFTVSSGNKNYSAKKGMLLNKKGTMLIAYPSAKGTIVIDKKVAVIGSYAFSACKYLTGVVIPKTVTRIEGCAFSNSNSLTNVTFQSITVSEIPYLCIFEKVNEACTILVPETSLPKYQIAFKNARMPKGARVDGEK